MEQSTSHLKLKGFTIAQFLCPHRYDPSTGRYRLSDKPVEVGARTVIIDEASMLTEEMFGALLQSLKGVHRLILIGDPRQLPPIGAGRPFSRELLYTALTRQKDRIVILHQGPRSDLRKYSSDDRSETARRLTNLFIAPSPIAIEGRFYEENLIHRTSRGEMVRSKSEVIIADHLAHRGVEYGYEQPLTIAGVTKYPDFTIEDMESGRNYYWEHCGMLHVPSYNSRWKEKLAWYKASGIEEGGGSRGTLIVTRDEANGSIDSSKITKIIERMLNA